MSIIRIDDNTTEQHRAEVWDSRDPDCPINLQSPSEHFANGQPTAAGLILIDKVILDRHESREAGNGLYAD